MLNWKMSSRAKYAFAAAIGVAGLFPSMTRATTVYSEDFDTDHTANWVYNSSISGDTASQADKGGAANVFFDYSTVGIPPAPGGTTTRGLQVQANLTGTGVFSAMSASPVGLSLPSQYTLTFNAWQNTIGPLPGGGSGSTQLTTASVGVSGAAAEFAGGTMTGVQFSASGDGGTNPDYRAYSSAFPDGPGSVILPGHGTYGAGTGTGSGGATDNANAYYSYLSNGSNVSAPAAQTALFSEQTGKLAAGAAGFAWHQWTIYKTDTDVTWMLDGKFIAEVPASFFPASFGGNDIAFGQADINTSSSTAADSNSLIFGLIDNIQVSDVVPEPSTLALAATALSLLFRRRRA